ncbi:MULTISPECIES: helix-turn-helix domain-containing protein [unclassified Bradyrhizobium]|uniref:helix-turn-helix domain-containing protein n=1 Tax=unclassified Bradyrhizobium TaxID=2631580 RepID=UPI0028E7E20E|nr:MULTISPECIES: helix-turn-helix domain-containing protein [unclassified Bradyrhizobium]
MEETDPQLRTLFAHLRAALNLLEEITSRRPAAPEAPAGSKMTTAAQSPVAAAIFSDRKIAYSIVEVMRLVDVSRSALYSEINEGRLRAVKRGRRTFILAPDLKKWVAGWPPAR